MSPPMSTPFPSILSIPSSAASISNPVAIFNPSSAPAKAARSVGEGIGHPRGASNFCPSAIASSTACTPRWLARGPRRERATLTPRRASRSGRGGRKPRSHGVPAIGLRPRGRPSASLAGMIACVSVLAAVGVPASVRADGESTLGGRERRAKRVRVRAVTATNKPQRRWTVMPPVASSLAPPDAAPPLGRRGAAHAPTEGGGRRAGRRWNRPPRIHARFATDSGLTQRGRW